MNGMTVAGPVRLARRRSRVGEPIPVFDQVPMAVPYEGDDVYLPFPRPVTSDGATSSLQLRPPPGHPAYRWQHAPVNLAGLGALPVNASYVLSIVGTVVGMGAAIMLVDKLMHRGKGSGHGLLAYLLLGAVAYGAGFVTQFLWAATLPYTTEGFQK